MLHQKHQTNLNDNGGIGSKYIAQATTISRPMVKSFSSARLPLACAGALLCLGLTCINPTVHSITNHSAYAVENTTNNSNITEGTSISLVIDGDTGGVDNDKVDSIVNVVDGDTAYISHSVTVNGTNIDTYSLQVSAASDSTPYLKHQVSGSNITIPGINSADGIKGNELEPNTWGYSWGEVNDNVTNLTYYAMPSYTEVTNVIGQGLLQQGTSDSNGELNFTKKLTFGGKFTSVPAGHYATTALLSLAISPKETTNIGFAGYTYMQDIDNIKCSSESIPIGTEGRLIDKRDNKVYWVAKLKDGLCWMTQNLDYDGGAISGYSGSDIINLVAGTIFSTSDQNRKMYYDPKEYVYSGGSTTLNCGEQSLSDGLKNCAGWKNVKDWTASTESNYTPIVNEASKTYDAHYLAGNYYNWMAATNGAKTSIGTNAANNGDEAVGSVCPIGWSLPLSGDNSGSNNNVDGSFYKLMSDLTVPQITADPYYFVYSGYVFSGSLYDASNSGCYWSANAGGVSSAYSLRFVSSDSWLSYNYGSHTGRSVRCVARP